MGPCDFRLIELIRQNKFLYDQSDPDFRNLEKKEITWRAIAAAQGSTAEICRRRFRSLRDRFVREKRQNKEQLLNGTVSNPLWLKMMFLWDHLRPHRRFNWKQQKHKRSQLDESESSGVDNSDQTQDHSEAVMRLTAQLEQRLADAEEQDVGQHQVGDESAADATSTQDVNQPRIRVIRRFRPIRPKPDPSNQRNNPIIVNLGSKESRNRGTSEAESGGWEEPHEMGEESRGDRSRMLMLPSTSTAGHSIQITDDDISSSLRISGNDAFCMMLKDSLDQVTNPLKLSLLRIKILTILHNEVYG